MAKSKRIPQHTVESTDEEKQARRDRITLIVFLIGAVLIVAGMWALAAFLSGN